LSFSTFLNHLDLKNQYVKNSILSIALAMSNLYICKMAGIKPLRKVGYIFDLRNSPKLNLVILIGFLLCCLNGYSQTILNGDFEFNSAGTNKLNISNVDFNSFMVDCNGFGNNGQLDIITSRYGLAQSGEWYVGIVGESIDMLSLKLSASLDSGKEYSLTFYDRSYENYSRYQLEIGLSRYDNEFSTYIYSTPSVPINDVWSKRTFTFIAPYDASFIVVKQKEDNLGSGWVQIDNFILAKCQFDVDLGQDTNLCVGEELMLVDTNSNATYRWNDGSTMSNFKANKPGKYSVEVTVDGCTKQDTIEIEYLGVPNINLSKDTVLCQGDTLVANVSTPNAIYLWQDNSIDSTLSILTSGTYWVNVTLCTCTSSDTINVKHITVPNPKLGSDTIICDDDSITLDTKITDIYTDLYWTTDETTQTINVSKSNTYGVIVSNHCGSSYDEITVNILQSPNVDLGDNMTFCGLTFPVQTLDAKNENRQAIYTWNTGQTTQVIYAETAGIYKVLVQNTCGIDSSEVELVLSPYPEINLNSDTSFCGTFEFETNLEHVGSSILWMPSLQTGQNVVLAEYGEHIVLVTNEHGCESKDTILIEYECSTTFFMPNAFTPNGDHINNTFKPVAKDIKNYHLAIYSRWGQLLFTSSNIANGWDGTFGGKDCQQGTYIFLVSYETQDRLNYLSGDVILFR